MYGSVISNTSKEMSCFSDFPFPEGFPSYLPHGLVLEYFRMYAQHFNLLRHIRFQVSRDPRGQEPGVAAAPRWDRTRPGAIPQGPRAFCILHAAFRPHVFI